MRIILTSYVIQEVYFFQTVLLCKCH